jgi:DNA-binding transcriptional regulator GbsR (MarR family)
MDAAARADFIESWGSMGALWGINRSMARIHALLLATKEPLGLDEITEELTISRGNASMCLKELRHWGVVRRIHLTGERRDFYIAEDDIWSMLFRIASERKKREFDPAMAALRKVLASTGDEDGLVKERLGELEEILRAVERVLERFLASEGASRGMLKFLSAQVPYPRRSRDEGEDKSGEDLEAGTRSG